MLLRKQIILLDIDGVFNALAKLDCERALVRHNWGTWQIATDNLEFLKYLSENVQCYWISTWMDESNVINDYISIKHFKALYKGNKQDIVNKLKRLYKNILVVDDEFEPTNTILLKPNPSTGLTEEDRNKIKTWVEKGN